MDRPPLSTADVARRLKCDVSTVNRMAKDGRLVPLLKFPGERGPNVFDADDVDRLAAELLQETEAKAEALRGESAATA
jgi:hypothetical protein